MWGDGEMNDAFLSDRDDEPVDMEEVREGMKLVPLPDMDCYNQDDNPCFPAMSDVNLEEDEPENLDANEHEESKHPESKTRPKAAAAAAAATTGGALAEAGPPPDFSVWTVEDDLLLKNAIEAGAAMEALAKGAMRFSRRYTVKELRERWKALLYDPQISGKAATRMVEAEAAFLESMRHMFPNRQKFQDFVQKRREKSVRATYRKRKRSTEQGLQAQGSEKGEQGSEQGAAQIMAAEKSAKEQGSEQAQIQVGEKGAQGSESPGGAVSGRCTVTPPDTVQKSSSPSNNGKVFRREDDEAAVQVQVCDDLPETKPTTIDYEPGEFCDAKGAHTNGGSEVYVLSSDDEDGAYSPEPKRACVSIEQMVCTFNTQETDVPAFDDSLLQEASDDDKCDATSAFKSPDRQEQQVMVFKEDRPLSLPSDNLRFSISAVSGKIGMPFEQDRGKVSNEAAKPSQAEGLAQRSPTSAASNYIPCQLISATLAPEVATSAALIDSAVNEVAPPEHQPYGGAESDNEFASFSDVEAMILDMDLDPGDDDVSARAESKRMYKQNKKALLRLEQAANASMQRSLVAKGAVAIFYGKRLRHFITKDEVSVGRSTQDNMVDIDLVKEGAANKVSRRQASIKLKEDGVFYLKNIGRRILHVNNVAVDTGQHVSLTSSCLIEVGGMWFIFEMNKKLTAQRAKEMASSRIS